MLIQGSDNFFIEVLIINNSITCIIQGDKIGGFFWTQAWARYRTTMPLWESEHSAQFGSRLEFLSYSLKTLHAGADILQDSWPKISKLQVKYFLSY